MTSNTVSSFRGLLRIAGALVCLMSAVIMGTGSASAYSDSALGSVQAQKAAAAVQHSVTTVDGAAVLEASPVAGCNFEYFCAYPNTNFGGTPIRMLRCGVDVFIPFGGNGSWINNQTAGTRARFKDANHHVIFTTPGAFSANTSYNWSFVWFVQAC